MARNVLESKGFTAITDNGSNNNIAKDEKKKSKQKQSEKKSKVNDDYTVRTIK